MVARIPASETFGRLTAERDENRRRFDDLERVDGSQIARALEKIRELFAQLDAQVADAISAISYTKQQIHDYVSGMNWLGQLPPGKGGTGTANAATNTFTSGGPWNTLYAKTATGEIGHAPSNRRFKQDIHDAFTDESPQLSIMNVDPAVFMRLPVQAFRYIDDVHERGGEAIQQYGFIAEDLAAAGLDPWLQFDHEGELIGVAYDKLPLAHHELIRRLWYAERAHLWRISELEAKADAQQLHIDDLSRRLAKVEGGGDAAS